MIETAFSRRYQLHSVVRLFATVRLVILSLLRGCCFRLARVGIGSALGVAVLSTLVFRTTHQSMSASDSLVSLPIGSF